MTEYAHNHPPRCCCDLQPADQPLAECPLCPEHGELAQLGNTNPPNDIPANVTPRTDYEYSCCHQLVGRPHTDYCPTVRNRAQTVPDQTPPSTPDPWTAPLTGIEVRNPLGMRHTPTHHTHSNDPAGVHPRTECHPDRCGMWATTTPQPPSQAHIAGEGPTPAEAARPTCRDPHCRSCGRLGEPTPLATPAPGGICPGCGADYDQTPTEVCTTPERHDNPR